MIRTRKTLLAALPAAGLALAGTVSLDPAQPRVDLVPAAQAAPANPCAPVANPCAPAAANPCAPAVANPCAPAAANPCAPSMANPCAPAKAMMKAAVDAVTGGMDKGAGNPFDVAAGWTQAPYGDAMPAVVKNYLRAAPYVGTGGLVADEGGMEKLKELGFKTVVNLNTPEEGSEAEGKAAEAAGLAYVNLAVSGGAPDEAAVKAFADLVENPETYPVLLHCHSSNRVGAMWALYRAGAGVPAEIAVQEGRTVGLKPSREPAVRARLGLPAEG